MPLSSPLPQLSLGTDASLSGCGAHLLPDFSAASGWWPPDLASKHINWLELQVVWLALIHWETRLSRQELLILFDNATVVAYIQKQGCTRSPLLCMLLYQVLLWCRDRGILLHARHILGHLNVLANSLSWQGQLRHTK